MPVSVKEELEAAYAEAQVRLIEVADELSDNGSDQEASGVYSAYAALAATDITKMVRGQDGPLDELYATAGLRQLWRLLEAIELQRWKRVVAVTTGFVSLASAAPVKYGLPVEEETGEEEETEPEARELEDLEKGEEFCPPESAAATTWN